MNTSIMTQYSLHVGDWVYVKDKCFRPVKIAWMDDNEIVTYDGDSYKYDELQPVYISNKIIVEFSLPVEGMILKGKEGNDYLFSVMDDYGDPTDISANSIHLLQRRYYDATLKYLKLNWRGANL